MRTKRIVKADVEAEVATMTDEQVTEAYTAAWQGLQAVARGTSAVAVDNWGTRLDTLAAAKRERGLS